MAVQEVDVAITGGGMVGASFALALAGTELKVALLESVPPHAASQPSFDERTTALGNSSRRIFAGLGVWEALRREAGIIRTIHVSDAGRFGFARLRAAEQGIDAFGYVVPNRVIGATLWSKLQSAPDISLYTPAQPEDIEIGPDAVTLNVAHADGTRTPLRARLLVAADGAQSAVRTIAGIGATVEDYGQVAVVTNVAADVPHQETAYERFTPAGPLAVLPLRDGSYAVIWTMRPEQAQRTLEQDDHTFLQRLQDRFGWRAGRFVRVGRRASYPLKLSRARALIANRTVLIGNAAQALHPVAGQGFNLGLRDAAMLAEQVVAGRSDPGASAVLERFAAWRERDRAGVIRFTDGLIKLFGSSIPGVAIARDAGLLLFDLMGPAKSALARVSAGFAGPTPRLARGLPVS